MEVKFAELLNSFGVTAADTTSKIRESVENFNNVWEDYNKAIAQYNSIEDEDEKEALYDEIKSFEADLKEADTLLCKKIESWSRNKELWNKKAEQMREMNNAKKKAKEQASDTAVQTEVQGTSIAEPQIQTAEQGTVIAQENTGNSSWVSWVLGLGLAVVTLGVASKYIKNE